MSPIVFSVIIPTFHRPNVLLRLVDQLLNQQGAPPYEVIVVDDGELADLKTALQALHQEERPVVYLSCPGEGPGQARNHGAAVAQGDFLIFIDDDCQVNDRWLADLCEQIARSSADIYYGPIVSEVHPYPPFLHTVELEDCPYRSTNIAFDKPLFHQLGGFDPRLSHWAEGWDIVSRARRHGAQLKYLPKWACSHAPTYHSPRYLQWRDVLRTVERMTYLMIQHRDSSDVQNHLNDMFSPGFWHLGCRAAFFLLPLILVSPFRAFAVFLLMNVAYDTAKLLFIQQRLLKKGFGLSGPDALKYLALNWTDDLTKALLRLTLFVARFRIRNTLELLPDPVPGEKEAGKTPAGTALPGESR